MPSLVYYGIDQVDTIPSTIALTDKAQNITPVWTFVELITSKLTINSLLTVNSPATLSQGLTVSQQLTANNDVWIKGDLYVNTLSKSTDTVSSAGNIQNGGGNIYAGNVHAVAYRALWADLGECFEIDEIQPSGTIVMFGGEKEITIAKKGDLANGVISTNPAIKMNDKNDDEHFPFITWCGRVPCRVIGKINKFDKIVLSDINGVGCAKSEENDNIIGIALENYDSDKEGLIEIVTQTKLF